MKDPFYGTHLPILQAVIEHFKVSSALEMGMGEWSTPLLCKHLKRVVSVENSQEYHDFIIKQCQPSLTFVHKVAGIGSYESADRIPGTVWSECETFYDRLSERIDPVDILFVDHWLGLRGLAIVKLIRLCRFLIFHDSTDTTYNYTPILKKTQLDQRTFIRLSGCGPTTDLVFVIEIPCADTIAQLVARINEYAHEYYVSVGWHPAHIKIEVFNASTTG
jgi:hypothetical protein